MQARERQANISIPPWDDGNDLPSTFKRIEHLKGIMLLHCETIKCVFDVIPACRKFSQSLRDLIVIHTGSQLPVLRAANLSFYTDEIAWRGLNGKTYNRKKLNGMQLPKPITSEVFEIMKKVIRVNPTQTEMALLGVLCLLSPGTLKHMISYTEQKDVGNGFHILIFVIYNIKIVIYSV